MNPLLLWGLFFLGIGASGTWLARRYAIARSLFDQPGERRSHGVATPRGGGIAIVLAVLTAAAVAWIGRESGAGALQNKVMLPAAAVGVLAVAVVGWLDDHRPLSPLVRLLVHVVASALFAAAVHANGGHAGLVILGFIAPLTLTNIWNFMDGINGLATTQALIVVAVLAVWLDGAWDLIAVALMASAAGFLPFNFPKARIFLGDVGSGSIGFVIGILCTVLIMQRPLAWGRPGVTLILLPLAPFLVDAGLTLARRVLRGEPWWTAHIQHAYQVCARRFGHAPVTLAYAAASAAGGIIASFMQDERSFFIVSLLLAWYTSAAVFWGWLQRSAQGVQGAHGNSADQSNRENG